MLRAAVVSSEEQTLTGVPEHGGESHAETGVHSDINTQQ